MKAIITLLTLAMVLSSCVVATRSDRPGQAVVMGGLGRSSVSTVVVVPVRHHRTYRHCHNNRYGKYGCHTHRR